MRWALADHQIDFQAEFAGWLDHLADPATVRAWLAQGPEEFTDRLAEAGWLAGGVPEDLGGAGGGLTEVAIATEALAARALPSGAWTASMIALPVLAAVPGAVEKLVEGGGYAALALPADLPPDSDPVVTEDAAGRLGGTVPFVLGAATARSLIVPAATRDGATRFHLIDAGAPGLRMASRPLLDASRDAAEVTFEDVPGVPLELDVPLLSAQMTLRAAVITAADSLGAAQRMLDLAVAYSLQREQFGVPIGSFQAVKHAAATILVGVEAARSIVLPAATAVDQGHEMADRYAIAAKAQVCASGVAAADSALTMHGAIGYTWEHDLQLFYKRAKLDAELFGGSHVWNDRLADLLDLTPR